MADVNSLYPAPPQPGQAAGLLGGNPLALISAANQLNALRQQQMEFAARRAQGNALQSAIGPDGTVNPAKAIAAVAADPAAALGAGEAVGGLLDIHNKMIANQTGQFGLASGQNQFVMNGLGALAGDPKLNKAKVQDFITTAARNTNIPSPILNGWLAGLPDDPEALRNALVSLGNAAMGTAALQPRIAGPLGPNGEPTTISQGAGNYAPGNATGAPMQIAPTPPVRPLGIGGAPAPVAPAAPAGIVTGLAPGVGEAQTAQGLASGHQFAGDLAQAANYKRSVFPLEQAIPALERLGPSGTGPGTETFNNVKSFIQSLGVPGVDASKIKDFDEAQKYLTDFVNQNGNTGTNDKLAAAFAGNPSTKISNAAAIDVAKSALALRRMQQGQVLQFQKTGLPEAQYSKWASAWQNQQDPRAYGFDQMSEDAQQKLIKSIPKTVSGKPNPEYAKFVSSLQAAHENGLLAPPQAQQ